MVGVKIFQDGKYKVSIDVDFIFLAGLTSKGEKLGFRSICLGNASVPDGFQFAARLPKYIEYANESICGNDELAKAVFRDSFETEWRKMHEEKDSEEEM